MMIAPIEAEDNSGAGRDAEQCVGVAGKKQCHVTPVSALVIVDAQRGLLDGEAAIPDAGMIVDQLAAILDAARAAGVLVVHLQNDGAPGTVDEPETAGWRLHRTLTPAPDELMLRKAGDDGFEGTELEAVLARQRIARLAVAGLLSEMCVSATIRGALRRGIEVVLVRDAHGTFPLDDIPASVVARVAEHALGDEVELVSAASVISRRPKTSD